VAADGAAPGPCPVCGGTAAEPVLDLGELPVNLNSQVERESSRVVRRGPIEIVVCTACAHLYNAAFDADLIEYDVAYENTLHYSSRFREHARALAAELVAEHDLVGGTAVEVGCGPGHFLSLLCELGVARGLGFDPSYDPGRLGAPSHPSVIIGRELLGAEMGVAADLAYSQQVLEHLAVPVDLLRLLRSVATRGAVFSEVPNGELMINQTALWDLLYEHVSYFTPVSLAVAHRRAGLSPRRFGTSFGNQFLWLDASPGPQDDSLPAPSACEPLVARSIRFGAEARTRIEEAADELDAALGRGPVALWGAGTKGMTYLNLVEGADRIAAVVDINPRKRGFGVPGTELAVVTPEDLVSIRPATVFIANPIYRDEIARQLQDVGLQAEVVALWQEEPATAG